MMNKNKNNAMDAKAKIGTLIGRGAVFDGHLSAPEAVRVDGTINGNCDCKELLIVGVEGKIIGDITAKQVTIAGVVQGDIEANGKLELLSTGKLTGNITAKSLVIDEDACFDGRCVMTTHSSDNTFDAGSAKTTGTKPEPEKTGHDNAPVETDLKKSFEFNKEKSRF